MKTFQTSFKRGDVVVVDDDCFQGDTLDNWCHPSLKMYDAARKGITITGIGKLPVENPETGKVESVQDLWFGQDVFPYITMGYHWKPKKAI